MEEKERVKLRLAAIRPAHSTFFEKHEIDRLIDELQARQPEEEQRLFELKNSLATIAEGIS